MKAHDPGAALLALPYSQADAEAGRACGVALVSITGWQGSGANIDESTYPGGVLRLAFDDIPMAEWSDRHGNAWHGPSARQVAQVLSFARGVSAAWPGSLLALHCLHGKSRSSALALAVMADGLGPGRETEAVSRLISRSGEPGAPADQEALAQMACNPGIIRAADGLLQRGGALERALETSMPRYVTWRRYWTERGWS